MMSPTAEAQVTLLNQTRTENVHSSPSYSFHILWQKTRQLFSDTIVWLTVDSGGHYAQWDSGKTGLLPACFSSLLKHQTVIGETDVARHH